MSLSKPARTETNILLTRQSYPVLISDTVLPNQPASKEAKTRPNGQNCPVAGCKMFFTKANYKKRISHLAAVHPRLPRFSCFGTCPYNTSSLEDLKVHLSGPNHKCRSVLLSILVFRGIPARFCSSVFVHFIGPRAMTYGQSYL